MCYCSGFDSSIGEEVDIPLPSAESKEEINEDEEVEEEIDEGEEDEEDKKVGQQEEPFGESGAETSESENVVVSPKHSRAKSVTNVSRKCLKSTFTMPARLLVYGKNRVEYLFSSGQLC